jgi:hypothetical protein
MDRTGDGPPAFVSFDTDGARKRPALLKSAHVIVTMGMLVSLARWFFLAYSLRSLDRNILKFLWIKPVGWSI